MIVEIIVRGHKNEFKDADSLWKNLNKLGRENWGIQENKAETVIKLQMTHADHTGKIDTTAW